MPRRAHKKSRNGRVECKRRHVKVTHSPIKPVQDEMLTSTSAMKGARNASIARYRSAIANM